VSAMPREFKLSKPLNMPAELRKAARESRRADELAEHAVMRAFEVFRVLKFSKTLPKTPEVEKAISRLDRATEQLGDARAALGDAVHQVEKVLEESGS